MPISSLDVVWTLLVAAGFIGNSYESYARPRGWPVGTSFVSPGFPTLAVFLIPIILIETLYYRGLTTAFFILVVGCALAWALTVTLRSMVQVAWFVLFAAAALIAIGHRFVSW